MNPEINHPDPDNQESFLRNLVGRILFRNTELSNFITLQQENLYLSQKILINTNQSIKNQNKRHYSPLVTSNLRPLYYSVEALNAEPTSFDFNTGKKIIIISEFHDSSIQDIEASDSNKLDDNATDDSYDLYPLWAITFDYEINQYLIYNHNERPLKDKDLKKLLKKIVKNQTREKENWNRGQTTTGILEGKYLING